MLYLITDQNNQTCSSDKIYIWNQNTSHQESNPNFYFPVYINPLIAVYMSPAYENLKEFHIWQVECSQKEDFLDPNSFRNRYSELTAIQEISDKITLPTNQQRMAFAILCTMNLILNPIYRNWALDYLKNIDTSKETAFKISNQLFNEVIIPENGFLPEHQYVDCAHAVLAAVMFDQYEEFTANAAHRAYFDSVDLDPTHPIDLARMAQIASLISSEEIAQVLM